MRRYLIAFTAVVFVVATGIGTAFAGGSSDTSGDGFHCYLFFMLPDGQFSQAMVNDSDALEVIKKVEEFIEKYEGSEGGMLDLAVGNIGGTVCEPIAQGCEECEVCEECCLVCEGSEVCSREQCIVPQ